MTFKQIREINSKHIGLKIKNHLTHMFNNEQWGATWAIDFMDEQDIKDLLEYLNKNKLNYFFGKSGIHIQ